MENHTIILFTLIAVTFFSCKKEKTIDVAPELIGTWEIQSYDYVYAVDWGNDRILMAGSKAVAKESTFYHRLRIKDKKVVQIIDKDGKLYERGTIDIGNIYGPNSRSSGDMASSDIEYNISVESCFLKNKEETHSYLNYMAFFQFLTCIPDHIDSEACLDRQLIISGWGVPKNHVLSPLTKDIVSITGVCYRKQIEN